MTPPVISRIFPHDAVPFVEKYCDRMDFDPGERDHVVSRVPEATWCGMSFADVTRAVLGLQPIDAYQVYVWGLFGDGSGTIDERRAGVYFMRVLDDLPFKLSGSILPLNKLSQHHAKHRGWYLASLSTDPIQTWERPQPGVK